MTIWVPKNLDQKPVYFCTLCDASFYEDELRQYTHHCVRGHSHEEIREHSLQAAAPGLFDPNHESGDVEWGRWIDRNHKAGNDPAKYMRTDDGKR